MNKKELVQSIVNMRTSADDETAARAVELYPLWGAGKDYSLDYRLQHGGKLYKVRQAHTSIAEYTPDITPALYTVINVTHAGTLADPIPYDGNMVLENGKYYTQYDKIYLCNRDTETAVFNDLADLVNIYVVEV